MSQQNKKSTGGKGEIPKIPDIFPESKMLENIESFFETVSTAPTHIPKTFSDSIKIYENAGTKRLYVYYRTSPTTKGWMYFTSSIQNFIGKITSIGTKDTPFPVGWSVTRRSGFPTGSYEVTHNLNSTDYIINALTAGTANTFIVCQNKTNNSFVLTSFDSAGNFTDAEIFFNVLLEV